MTQNHLHMIINYTFKAQSQYLTTGFFITSPIYNTESNGLLMYLLWYWDDGVKRSVSFK